MAQQEQNTVGGAQYKQVLPSGLAAEIASGTEGRQGDAAALRGWLRERLEAASVPPERLATLSGVASADMTRFLEGQDAFPLDADHLQRLTTALIELHAVTDPAQVWEAAGFVDSDCVVPPARIVQSMSGTA